MKAKEFGKYIKKIREEKELTIRQLELYSGISNSYLSLMENGKRGVPSAGIIKKLAVGLKTPYEDLLSKAGYLDENGEKNLNWEDDPEIKKNESSVKLAREMDELLKSDDEEMVDDVLKYIEFIKVKKRK